MKIGLLVEGNFDEIVFPKIIEKIISSKGIHQDLEYETVIARGPIITKLNEATKLFFETEHSCIFAVFHNDFDNEKIRKRKISFWISRYLNSHPNGKIVFVSPDPHFEEWFIAEEISLKHVLDLSSTIKLPYPNVEPKTRVVKLIKEKESLTKTTRDFYEEIAIRLNLNLLEAKDRTFKKFQKELLDAIR